MFLKNNYLEHKSRERGGNAVYHESAVPAAARSAAFLWGARAASLRLTRGLKGGVNYGHLF